MAKFLNKSVVTFIDSMGDDLSVVNAARVSFNKQSFKIDEKDKKLIEYLSRHNHWSPFAHAFLSIQVKAPIFVAQQLVKHQVGLAWNEVSRWYVDDEPEFYIPDVLHKRPDASIKQGAGEPYIEAAKALHELKHRCEQSLTSYSYYIEQGLAPEEARIFLPLNTMTEWIWSGSLMAFCRVCNLRLDAHAQRATQEVAAQIHQILQHIFPNSTAALVKKINDE